MRRAGQEAFTAQPLEGEGTKRDATVIVVGRDRGREGLDGGSRGHGGGVGDGVTEFSVGGHEDGLAAGDNDVLVKNYQWMHWSMI